MVRKGRKEGGTLSAKVTGIVTKVGNMLPNEKGLTEYFHVTLMNGQDGNALKKRLTL